MWLVACLASTAGVLDMSLWNSFLMLDYGIIAVMFRMDNPNVTSSKLLG